MGQESVLQAVASYFEALSYIEALIQLYQGWCFSGRVGLKYIIESSIFDILCTQIAF